MISANKIAIVTGAGSGIGREVAINLLDRDYRVVLAGRRVHALQETIDRAGSAGGHAMAIGTDVSNPQSVQRLFNKTQEEFSRLDLLFNNAGANIPARPLEEVAVEESCWIST